MNNISCVGISQSGKTTFLALMHLRLRDLQICGKLSYKLTITKSEYNLHEIASKLSKGNAPLPTEPKRGCLPFLMEITFPNLFTHKTLSIKAIDVGGEAIKKLLDIMTPTTTLSDVYDEHVKEKGISFGEFKEICDTIFGSSVFLLIVDGSKIENGNQDVELANFIHNVREFKKKNYSVPLKCIGLIVTKIDEISQLNHNPTQEQLIAFIKKNLRETYASLLSLDLKCTGTNVFFTWLNPTSWRNDYRPETFEVDKSKNLIKYPEDEYDKIKEKKKKIN